MCKRAVYQRGGGTQQLPEEAQEEEEEERVDLDISFVNHPASR